MLCNLLLNEMWDACEGNTFRSEVERNLRTCAGPRAAARLLAPALTEARTDRVYDDEEEYRAYNANESIGGVQIEMQSLGAESTADDVHSSLKIKTSM